MDLILYHNGCPDGWCAAYIGKLKYPEAELVALNHGLSLEQIDNLIIRCQGKDVLMVDYSLPTRQFNDQLNDRAKSFRILDHHKSAREVLDGASYATFDMKRSGAGLAWDYLFGKDMKLQWFDHEIQPAFIKTRPWWVDYTEDQDLWNWALPMSQEINAFLMTQPRTVQTWAGIVMLDKKRAEELGFGTRAYIEYYTRCVLEHVQPGILNFEGTPYRVGVLNIAYAGVSEAGNAVCKQLEYPLALAWFEHGDGQIQFSLRSNRDEKAIEGGVDCSAIAKSFGGGGHRNAAGFQLSVSEGRDLVDKVLVRPNYIERMKNIEEAKKTMLDNEILLENRRQLLKAGSEVLRRGE